MKSVLVLVLAASAALTTSQALATPWPISPVDSCHPLGNNWGNYQDYGGGPYFHNGVDCITPDVHGRRVDAVAHGWVKAWGTIQADLHYRLAICDTSSDFTGRAPAWLYAHIDPYRWHRALNDEVQEGDSIGYLVEWPIDATFDHCHFARISDTGATWMRFPDVTWWFIQNPLTIIQPNSDLLAPVIENARSGQKLAFCRNNANNSYLRYDSLVGDVDIIAKVYDKTGYTTGNSTWDKLAPYQIDYSIVRIDGHMVVPWTVGLSFYGQLDGSLTNIVYKADNTCRSEGDYDYREYYYIITNTDGDSVIEATDASGKWATGSVGDAEYWVYVRALDIAGNTTLDSMKVRTYNNVNVEELPYAMVSQPLGVSRSIGRGSADVRFSLANSGDIRVRIIDLSGRTVATLADGRVGKGDHRYRFEAPAAGIYVAELEVKGDGTYSRKITVVR